MDAPDTIPTRWSLIKRLKDWDDQASWREFFDMYWRLIYNVARKAGLPDADAQAKPKQSTVKAKAARRAREEPTGNVADCA